MDAGLPALSIPRPLLASTAAAIGAGLIFTLAYVLYGMDSAPNGASAPTPPNPGPDPFLPNSRPVTFTDPAHDAADPGSGDAATVIGCAVGRPILGQCVDPPVRPPGAGNPGPHFDILEGGFAGETARQALFFLGLQQLSPDLHELRDPDGVHRILYFRLCWSPDPGQACDRHVVLEVVDRDGHLHLESLFEIRNERCNAWAWCAWDVPVSIDYGNPARLTFAVPKAYLTWDGAPLRVGSMSAETGWSGRPAALPLWAPSAAVDAALLHVARQADLSGPPHVVDATPDFSFHLALTPPSEALVDLAQRPLLVASWGSKLADDLHDPPELDLLWSDVGEDGTDLLVAFQVQSFQGAPDFDYDISLAVGLKDRVWRIGAHPQQGRIAGYLAPCDADACALADARAFPVSLQPGSPALLTVRVPKSAVGSPQAGQATELLWATTAWLDADPSWTNAQADASLEARSAHLVDSRLGGHPFVFGAGHRLDPSWSPA